MTKPFKKTRTKKSKHRQLLAGCWKMSRMRDAEKSTQAMLEPKNKTLQRRKTEITNMT